MGSVLLTYVGRPLQAIGKWDEVQFLFYPFNSHAAGMCRSNISSFRLVGFSNFITTIGQERPFISTSEFAEKLFKDTCGPENISHPNYWRGHTYQTVDRSALEEASSREERLRIIQDANVNNDALISTIYNEMGVSRDAKFETPDITMLTETVPAKEVEEGEELLVVKVE